MTADAVPAVPPELRERPVPEWFSDAKLGIFVHWGPSSVPAFAPPGPSPFELADTHGWAHSFAYTPYSEWYRNSMLLDGPTKEHHARVWGDAGYEVFGERFAAASAAWDPEAWADLFATTGARYVVLITKHHDGFLLWPSATPNPHLPRWGTARDLVGELAAAVRARGLRFGCYYSGGLDWTFGGLPIDSFESMLRAIPQTDEYLAYADAHWRELIDRYEPCVLWNDIGYPMQADLHRLFADYYDRVPDGVVNNRFDFLGSMAGTTHHDFVTPEYTTVEEIRADPWETCRGIGTSFGFNREETDDDLVGEADLVHLVCDVASKGGNLLLDVGPAADGSVSHGQERRLLALGHWLARHGEAIHGTRPWRRPDGRTACGVDVRFTSGPGALYAILLGDPAGREVVVEGLAADIDPVGVRVLGQAVDVPHRLVDGDLRVELLERPAPGLAHVLRISL